MVNMSPLCECHCIPLMLSCVFVRHHSMIRADYCGYDSASSCDGKMQNE